MPFDKDEARRLLKAHGLRVTGPRLAVLEVLSAAHAPLSHTDVLERLGATDWDQATIYRNLVKLKEAGVAVVAGRVGGLDRYALARPGDDGHQHPHFMCEDCGQVACLPAELSASISMEGPWAASVENASIQLRGACPSCREASASSS